MKRELSKTIIQKWENNVITAVFDHYYGQETFAERKQYSNFYFRVGVTTYIKITFDF